MSPVGADGLDDGDRIPLDTRVLVLWRLRAGAAVALLVVLSSAGALLAIDLVAAAAVGVLLTVVLGGGTWWATRLAWRNWGFAVGARALHLDHGVFTRRSSTIPFHRVQHIDLEAGPVERRLGLTTLVLRTASATSDSTVPGIDTAAAEDLRRRILERVGSGDAT